MPLFWDVSADAPFVAIRGDGLVGRADLKACLSALKGTEMDRRPKVFDLSNAEISMTRDDLDLIGVVLRRYCGKAAPGAMAFVVHGPENIDMAVLIKQRVASDRVRIFPTRADALTWLERDAAQVPRLPERRRQGDGV